MDAHSRVWYLLHKCNRARREHVASNMLFQLYYECVKQTAVCFFYAYFINADVDIRFRECYFMIQKMLALE